MNIQDNHLLESGNNNAYGDDEPLVNTKTSRVHNLIDRIMAIILDWGVLIVMMVLPSSIHNYIIAYIVSFLLGLGVFGYSYLRSRWGLIKIFPKSFELGILGINFILFLIEVIGQPSYEWSKRWVQVISNASLFGIVLITIIIGNPFTLEFARERTPERLWTSEKFIWANYIITFVWLLDFGLNLLFALLSIYVTSNDFLHNYAGLIVLLFAILFTRYFPVFLKTYFGSIRS